ncbi:hypothetical protein NDU88_007911 [Pleurodeles waltl]|uniref:Uncharacterized protein n=1 Tax=Pleurodeles waltl TaxID=8319 RepID=A0AAV7N4T2_PLEWA|nr:hypothetical protein NDU88_007911 [Pleurodeles waltl]
MLSASQLWFSCTARARLLRSSSGFCPPVQHSSGAVVRLRSSTSVRQLRSSSGFRPPASAVSVYQSTILAAASMTSALGQ